MFASPSGISTVQAATTDSTFHSTDGTIHFLTLNHNTDAILIECDGKFGMVDSGEDNDYPDGSDPRYPLRAGITKGLGFENQVISYLESMGVTKDNFEFYIGTHPHSDHIGSADEIIRAFHPKRVYLEPYSDSDITDSTHLWDNLYVYDRAVAAAKETGATLIQYFNTDAPLYPETVTVKGSIVWTVPEEPEVPKEPEEIQKPEQSTPNDSDADTELKGEDDSDVPAQEPDTTESDISSDSSSGSESESEPDAPAATEEPAMQNNDTVTETSSETIKDLSAFTETQSDVVSLTTVSTAATPVTETSTQNDDSASINPPDTMSVTLSWGDNQSVTLTSDTTSEHGSVTKVSENQWDYEFQSIPKYDDTKSAYTYTVTPEADGYSFSKLGDSDYDFSCAPADASAETTASTSAESLNIHPLDSGILDEDVSSSLSGTSDNLVTSSIPSSDRVVAGTDSDPTNANQDEKAASGQRSIYENETGYVSTPIFYLGNKNKLEIEIMNYDVPRPQPDANYYSLGVKVTSMQTGTTAFLSGDINNYNGTETELAKKLGHVNLLKLGHHGSYGSNTDGYIRSLNPDMAILTGTYTYVTNTTINGECGTRDTLLAMGERGTPLYATGWYTGSRSALVIHLNQSLTNNIPSGRSLVAIGNIDGSTVAVY